MKKIIKNTNKKSKKILNILKKEKHEILNDCKNKIKNFNKLMLLNWEEKIIMKKD